MQCLGCLLRTAVLLLLLRSTRDAEGQTAVPKSCTCVDSKSKYLTTAMPATTAPTPDPTTAASTPDTVTAAPTPDTATAAPTPDTTTAAPTPDPTTAAPTPGTATAELTPDPTTKLTTPDPTTKLTTPDPTTKLTTPDPTTKLTTPDPTTKLTTPDPTTKLTTPDPTTKSTTPDPTTAAPTPDTTTKSPTPDPTTAAPTPDTATKLTTPDPTTAATTPDPTTAAPTPDPTTAATPPDPTTAAGYTTADNATLLSSVLGSNAFNASSPGHTFNASSNQFTVPATAGTGSEDRIVIDLLVGPTGSACRPMPYLEQICVSSLCDGCNLNLLTAAAARSLDDSLNQTIFDVIAVDNTTVCAGREVFKDLGDFRYIVFLPQGSPAPSQPYAFRVSLSGNFSSYSCSSRRRRGLLDGPPGDPGTGPVDGDFGSFFRQLSRSRRAAPDDCSCPVGQDPVFSSVRTVLISWEFPLKAFSSSLSDNGTTEYVSLARESYYLLMDAVRNASVSNLTSVVADFFDISFSRVNALAAGQLATSNSPRSSSSSILSTKLTGWLTVRNDSFFSDSFLLQQLEWILPGYGRSIINLNVTALLEEPVGTSSMAVVLIIIIVIACVLTNAAIATGVGIVACRMKRKPQPRKRNSLEEPPRRLRRIIYNEDEADTQTRARRQPEESYLYLTPDRDTVTSGYYDYIDEV